MGADTCDVWITVRDCDRQAVAEAFAVEDSEMEVTCDPGNAAVELYITECSEEATDELAKLAKKRVPFWGHHNKGSWYEARAFGSLGDGVLFIPLINNDPSLEIGWDGQVSKSKLQTARLTLKLIERAKKRVEAWRPPKGYVRPEPPAPPPHPKDTCRWCRAGWSHAPIDGYPDAHTLAAIDWSMPFLVRDANGLLISSWKTMEQACNAAEAIQGGMICNPKFCNPKEANA